MFNVIMSYVSVFMLGLIIGVAYCTLRLQASNKHISKRGDAEVADKYRSTWKKING